MSAVEGFVFDRTPAPPYDQEARESFTAMLLLNASSAEELSGAGWVGVVVAHDGETVFSTGKTWSRERALAGVREFIQDWRLRGYS